MTVPASPPTDDRWCDIEGTHISLFCQVEQVAETTHRGMLPSRLHQRGHVVGRGLDCLYVRFDDNHLVSLRPHLLRVLPELPGEF